MMGIIPDKSVKLDELPSTSKKLIDIKNLTYEDSRALKTKTPITVLQELTVQKGLAPPDFQIVLSDSGVHETRFDYTVTSWNNSKWNWTIEKEVGIYKPSENPVDEFKVLFKESADHFKAALNCIVELLKICMKKKIPAPEFNEVSRVGPPHAKEFYK
ncbi:uncharacterized protein LOC115882628 [Sitophilus oryzae]|uniref:Uncharacterized protein LOC115882628 n=1 Tax=Sitophilus oryzae TaxID=7048 RepID=A0A6J2Y0X5_SITOR|nr:uncharacterized protein LOC115882628 [Sitophilus oryzae]